MTPLSRHSATGVALMCLLVLVAAAALVIRLRHPQFTSAFNTDEADYATALRYGVLSNYLGLHERSGPAFIGAVLREYRATGRPRAFRDDWRTGDSAGLRHYHPPSGLLPASVLAGVGIRSEPVLRSIPLLTGLLTCVVSGLLAAAMLRDGSAAWSRSAMVLACALVGASPYQGQASAELSFHAAFGLVSTAALLAFTLAGKHGKPAYWLCGCALTGAAVVTIPYWILLLPVAALVLWRSDWAPNWTRLQLLTWGGALALGACVLAWPPGLLTLNLVKPVMLYAWILVNPLESAAPPVPWYVGLASQHIVLTVGLFVAAYVVAASWRSGGPRLVVIPVLIFIALFAILNVRVWHMKPLYSASLIPGAAALAAAGFAALGSRLRPKDGFLLVFPLVALVLVGPTAAAVSRHVDTSWRASVRELRRDLAGTTVLVVPRPAAGTMRYYLEESTVVPGPAEAADEQEIRRLIAGREIDAILSWEPPGSSLPVEAQFTIRRKVPFERGQIAVWVPGHARSPRDPRHGVPVREQSSP
jgi:hypothetical protein